jgi:hypothetical protein
MPPMASPVNFLDPCCFGVGVHNAKIDFGKLCLCQIFDKNQSGLLKADTITRLVASICVHALSIGNQFMSDCT